MTRPWWHQAALAAPAFAVACTLGPAYKRPEVTPPDVYRGSSKAAAPSEGATPFGEAKWFDVFQDDGLRALIRTALEHNYSLQIAAVRVLEAQAQLGIARSSQFPSVSAGGTIFGEHTSPALGFPSLTAGVLQGQASAAWELDFWGKFRRATEAARAQVLSTEWGRRAVVTSLVAQVASAYFDLRALDLELQISTRTLASREESLRLTQVRERGGATSLVDVRQAEQLVYGAASAIVQLQQQIEQQENLLRVLLGDNPGPVARGRALTDQPQPKDIPAGLPSSLLERRPDVQQAEQELVAANALIGVAKAAYFPQIPLTMSGGAESSVLHTLFTSGGPIASAALAATVPVFTAGRTRAQVAVAEARRTEAVLAYQKTVNESFREVSDALVGYQRAHEYREQQALLLTAAQDARRLADIRYQGGATGYLEVLDADTRLFSAEFGLAQAHLNELSGLVALYRSLGGGWEP